MARLLKLILLPVVTLILAACLKNDFIRFLLGLEVLLYALAGVQTLYCAKKVSGHITVAQRTVCRNEPLHIGVEIENRGFLPVSEALVRIAVRVHPERDELLMSGKIMLNAGETGTLSFALDSVYCAFLEARLERIVIRDPLGIFRRRCSVPRNEKTAFYVLPEDKKNAVQSAESTGRTGAGDPDERGLNQRRAQSVGESMDIRLYRRGDSMKMIHWKLSARMDELLVREMTEPVENLTRIYLDLESDVALLKDRSRWDRLIDRVYRLSASLLVSDQKHIFLWMDAEEKRLVSSRVTDRNTQRDMLCHLLHARPYDRSDLVNRPEEKTLEAQSSEYIEIRFSDTADS